VTASKELSKYKLDLWKYRRSDGTRWHHTSSLKGKINELAVNNKNKNIRDLYRGIN
jgi:hypothetical protein